MLCITFCFCSPLFAAVLCKVMIFLFIGKIVRRVKCGGIKIKTDGIAARFYFGIVIFTQPNSYAILRRWVTARSLRGTT